MKDNFEQALNLLVETPVPNLAKSTGDLMLYDSLIAGVAHNFVDGRNVDRESIPEPDLGTIAEVTRLRELRARSEDQDLLLRYFDRLEAVRRSLIKAVDQSSI